MLIRSQDKKNIVNLDNVYAIYRVVKTNGEIKENYDTDIRCSNGLKETEGMLGTYSTEEKALKVLDMIQDAYCGKPFIVSKKDYSEEEMKKISNGSFVKLPLESIPGIITHVNNCVFEMPQDSEV